ncbi:putative DNAJ heat shock N-terminal domain-containing protein [Quillaja saponaria]|uniref:DNAJ heat shock N-terminal domain-containing protein n=1 Tax=Quillaja saponaria TaxID=32244 RepID=A0AAD7LE16_QUISA|nr:putative DNAJ heat shock N-terminal domain-containing protein [Quillaja saponaria]
MATRVPSEPVARSYSMASTIKAYSLPLILFAGAIFYQLFVIPKAFPSSHYDVLGIKRYSSIEEVKEAYEKLDSKWKTGMEVQDTVDFIKIRYAYEMLTNPSWKRDYDIFGIDEQLHVVENAKKQYAGRSSSELDFPLLDTTSSGSGDYAFNIITSKDFQSLFPDAKPWLVQLYSLGSRRCAQFSDVWKRIDYLLDGVAHTGMLELGEVQLAAYLAEKTSTGKPFFRNGLPSLIAIPSGCQAASCLFRFEGELSVDAITDWFATTVLGLPRIIYYTKETLVQNFLAKTSPHKVKVIFFSTTGERAAPFIRQASRDYWAYASFAFIIWREEEFSLWQKAFEVESAPAIVFLKDPGLKPIVHHGSVNNSWFLKIMEHNKRLELPQLRSVSSMELGCDPRGYSRAGYDTVVWYCAILAGRPGMELNKMRESMCRIQELLSKHNESNGEYKDQSLATAADAFRKKRLTFAWLDGEKQKDYCNFYLSPETSHDTCGPRRDLNDVPQLFVVRYQRNNSNGNLKTEEEPRSIWDLHVKDLDPASQYVSTYKGPNENLQIGQWISGLIKDGDSRDLPVSRFKTPALVPEDREPVWSRSVQRIPLENMKQRTRGIMSRIYDSMGDPRIGPSLLLGALISYGTIWLWRSQPAPVTQSNQPNHPTYERSRRQRDRSQTSSNKYRPPSVTDLEPKDSFQMPLSDSESE